MIAFKRGRGFLVGPVLVLIGAASVSAIGCAEEHPQPAPTTPASGEATAPPVGTSVVVPPRPPASAAGSSAVVPGKRNTSSQRWAARKSRPDQKVGTNVTFAGINRATAALAPLAAGPAALAAMAPDGQADIYAAGNWANSPLLQVAGGGAAAVAAIDNVPGSPTFGEITNLTLVAGGEGFAQTPNVVFTGGGGTGAVFAAQIDGVVGSPTYQQVIGFNKVSGGSGYSWSPDVWIEGTPIPGTGVRKFVDGLPGLCGVTPGSVNNLGQCIPLANKMSAAATAAKGVPTDGDYYEIGLVEYTKQLHSDLPATKLRGYRDMNPAANANAIQYFGPMIIANRNRPVRVRFKNNLPVGTAGELFIPVDKTFAGAGFGPDGTPYSQNRANLHLHGGNSPWISDGTPHQWTAPAGESAFTNFTKGVSTRDVPDMPASNAGEMSFYWTNQQSGRLMFYHDHTLALTRLNVYAGEAAGYLLVDPDEEDSLADATVPGVSTSATVAHPNPAATDLAHFLPLIIQEKTFTPDNGVVGGQLAATDPTWNVAKYGGKGQLWFPHVYSPNQNPADLTGTNGYGRYDYGAWFWPAQDPTTFVADGRPFACSSAAFPGDAPPAFPPLLCPGIPKLSGVPEAFMDTPLVNGTAYPSMTVEPAAYRFQMLTAGNDRTWNFGLYYAATKEGIVCKNNAVADLSRCTEVSMVAAVPHNDCSASVTESCMCNPPFNPAGCFPAPSKIGNCSTPLDMAGGGLVTAKIGADGKPLNTTGLEANCWPSSWPTDGRDGGVPDPANAGPPFIQIGTEGGLLPSPVVIPSTPVGYDYNRRSITVLNILSHGLLLGPAERADVVVDFSTVPAGSALVLYNDGPAPAPGFDPRIDYYTGNPDQSPIGGAPSTPAGYGPNTRTVMQIKVQGQSTNRVPFSLPALTAALPQIFASSQDPIIIPETAYPAANGGAVSDTYSRIQDSKVSFFAAGGPVGSLNLVSGGTGYTSAPLVTIGDPGCAPGPKCATATATATIGAPVASLSLSGAAPLGGSGYTTTPVVTVAPPPCVPSDICVPAAAEAVLQPTTVAQVNLLSRGQNFSSLPTVTVDPPGCVGCLTAKVTPIMNASGTQIASLHLDSPGSGYTADPGVTISGGGGTNARADATLTAVAVASINVVEHGLGYKTAPVVTISTPGNGGQRAHATAALGPASVLALQLTNGGAGYTSSNAAPTVTFTGGGGNGASALATGEVHDIQRKAIQELFTLDYGRMNATMGVELPFTNFNTQTTIPYGYADPPTELVKDGETQFWKVTHNGVDTHFMHFHLFSVQVINRVGWDGQIKPPDSNEIGWKDTVRMNPLEDIIVALRPYQQKLPWPLPVSVHALDVTKPVGAALPYVFGSVDPSNNPATVTNDLINFGFEYVWHCHILGHEENDMMRSIGFVVPPASPTTVTAALSGARSAQVTWTTNGVKGETNFVLQRATNVGGPWSQVGPTFEANATHYVDGSLRAKTTYYYRVVAANVVGYKKSFAPPATGWPTMTASSDPTAPSAAVVVP